MNIKAKKIRITFDNSSEDYWEAACESGIEFYDAIHMIARAWTEHDEPKEPLIKDEKKRKIIRLCASLDSVEDAKVVKRSSDDTTTLIFGKTTLTLKGRREYDSLQQCGTYTIAELCGDSEEEA